MHISNRFYEKEKKNNNKKIKTFCPVFIHMAEDCIYRFQTGYCGYIVYFMIYIKDLHGSMPRPILLWGELEQTDRQLDLLFNSSFSLTGHVRGNECDVTWSGLSAS